MAAELSFRAMGTSVHLIAVGAPEGALERAGARIVELERKWSRFIDTSDISQMNRAAGAPVIVSPETFELVARGVDGWRATSGRFDPTILGSMLAVGYDRTFEDIAGARATPGTRGYRTGCNEIEMIASLRSVRLPADVGFDPGGVGKGYAADLVVQELLDAGARGACANVGGDLRALGQPPDGDAWVIEIEHPLRAEPVATFGIAAGAIATTSRVRRAWVRNGVTQHHLIDPATGEPADTGFAQVTVLAGEAWWAEIWAKAAFLAGPEHIDQVARDAEVIAFCIADDGSVREVSRVEAA